MCQCGEQRHLQRNLGQFVVVHPAVRQHLNLLDEFHNHLDKKKVIILYFSWDRYQITTFMLHVLSFCMFFPAKKSYNTDHQHPNTLNCFKDYTSCIYILNWILELTWPKYMKLSLEHQYMLSVLHSLYHACWCFGNFRAIQWTSCQHWWYWWPDAFAPRCISN